MLYRDVLYEEWRVAVELDGMSWHSDAASRSRDMSRDLDAVAAGITTVRLGWRHVEEQPCRTAAQVGKVLTSRGWGGRPRACGPACTAVSSFPVTG